MEKISGHDWYTHAWTIRPKYGVTEEIQNDTFEWFKRKKNIYAWCWVLEDKGTEESKHLHIGVLTSYKPSKINKNQYEINRDLRNYLRQRFMESGVFDSSRSIWCKTWYEGDLDEQEEPDDDDDAVDRSKMNWANYMKKEKCLNFFGLNGIDEWKKYLQHNIPLEERVGNKRETSGYMKKVESLFKEHNLPFATIKQVSMGLANLMFALRVLDVYDMRFHNSKLQAVWMFMNNFKGDPRQVAVSTQIDDKAYKQCELKKRKIGRSDLGEAKKFKPTMIESVMGPGPEPDLGGL